MSQASLQKPTHGTCATVHIQLRSHFQSLTQYLPAKSLHSRAFHSNLPAIHSPSTMVLSQRNECNPTTRRKPSLISPPSLPAINETSSSPEDSPSKGRSAEGCGTDASPCKLYETGEGEEGGTDDDYEDDGIDRFRRRKYFLTRHGMMLHPYDHEAPYMQAYDPVSLDKWAFFLSYFILHSNKPQRSLHGNATPPTQPSRLPHISSTDETSENCS